MLAAAIDIGLDTYSIWWWKLSALQDTARMDWKETKSETDK